MSEYIEREALLRALSKEVEYDDDGEQEINSDTVFITIEDFSAADVAPVVHENYCIDIVEFIDWLDVGHLRSADEKCFSERNVAAMVKDFAITNPAIPGYVTRCKECRYGLPAKLFGRNAIACTEQREELHSPEWFCAYGAKMDGQRREDTK